jgi:hypothetical protein
MVFVKSNKKGEPLTCKFCRAPVWFCTDDQRWHDVGGETPHVDNCEAKKAHCRGVALDNAEARRRNR